MKGWRGHDPRKYVGGQSVPRPLKCYNRSLNTVVGQLCKPDNMNDERLVSIMEGKTNFWRHLKQFDGLARLTRHPSFYDRSSLLLGTT